MLVSLSAPISASFFFFVSPPFQPHRASLKARAAELTAQEAAGPESAGLKASAARQEKAPLQTYIRRPPGPMPEACEKSAPPNPQPARSHGKVRQVRRRLKHGLADVASGAAQHAGGDGSGRRCSASPTTV